MNPNPTHEETKALLRRAGFAPVHGTRASQWEYAHDNGDLLRITLERGRQFAIDILNRHYGSWFVHSSTNPTCDLVDHLNGHGVYEPTQETLAL